MARKKQSIIQRSFSYMEIREDFLEGDDLDVRGASLRAAQNMKVLATRTTEARPGTFYMRTMMDAEDVIEIRPASGLTYGMILNNTSLQIIDIFGRVIHTETSVPWADAASLWVENFRSEIIIGDETAGMMILEYDSGSWSFTTFAFIGAAGGEAAQPYWAFELNTTIQPSALTGTITVTAADPIWVSAYVGQRIRYGQREIMVTEKISSTVLRGDVINRLPPSFRVTVEDSTEYRVGEAVIGADTNFQGLVIAISGYEIDVITLEYFEGPDVGEEFSSPGGSSVISAKVEISPLASPIWDEPLMSPLRGYPRSAGGISGRMVLIDFPQVPDLIALSSSRSIKDFKVGASDDDAIVRQVGDGKPRWLHAVNMGDLLLLSDNGVYFVPARENGVISPSTFNTVFIDEVGANEISPVKADDGVIFVESSGEQVSAAMLDANVISKWTIKPLTTFHNHQIKSPKKLCGPSLGSAAAEKYMFVVNGDGTLAAVSWQGNLRDEVVGFAPWDTEGLFVNVSPIFGGYWAIVDRVVEGGTVRFLERFSDDAYLDCSVETDGASETETLWVNGEELYVNGTPLAVRIPALKHLPGATVTYYARGWDGGDHVVNSDGTVTDEPEIVGSRQIGLNFQSNVWVWPIEQIESPRIGMLTARTIRTSISVQGTLGFQARRNGATDTVGAYGFGDDLSLPPVPRTKVYRFAVYGNRDHPEIEFTKHRPGPFRVLSIGQEVQI